MAGTSQAPAPRRRPGPKSYERRSYQRKLTAVLTLCRRLEAGESMAEACRCPTLPPRATMAYWLETDPALGGLVAEAQAAAERSYGPGRRAVHRWSWRIAREVLSRLEDGRGLDEVCAARDMPAYATVMAWLRKRPDFRAEYARARERQAERLFDLAWRIACEADEDTVKTARLKIQTLKYRVAKLAPRTYGTLKAQAPQPAAGEAGAGEGGSGEGGSGGDGAAGDRKLELAFTVRRFAVTPGRKVIDVTWAGEGMDEDGRAALRQGVMRGEITEADLERLTAAAHRRALGV
ncbi:hypothetical protein [Phenylobacterium sp.]|uniref:terminase small subunit-like protein n=1 Tax=Phenylobacterium sp. TaxID=1871053 RepID=UPI00301C9889